MALLQVDHINVYYGAIHAIKDVSFHVDEGEVVTLIGANGAGKSTTLKTVSGLLHAKSGKITFQGKDLKGMPAHAVVSGGIAQVPEGRRVFLRMTVEENLEMGAYTQPRSSIAASMKDVFQRFPRLEERRTQVAGTLSGGEQQMLAMGRALMSHPRLLMMDDVMINVSETYIPERTRELDFRSQITPKTHLDDFCQKEYYQVFSERYGFQPNLSILDLLFNLGPESRVVLRDSLKQ